ncbi:MAG: hypothetical protein ABFD83_08250 [Armatimonadota bacterium]
MPKAVCDIWSGMEDKIWVIHPACNTNFMVKDLYNAATDSKGELGKKLGGLALNEPQVEAIIDFITRSGSHVVEGDAAARMHILATLRSIYNPIQVGEINSWSLGKTDTEIENNRLYKQIRHHNIVLIGGPEGNTTTDLFLNKAKLDWLFPKDDRFQIRRWPDDTEPMRPEGKRPTLASDCGVFIKTTNPFNERRRLYAVMGAFAWGTQAAAAAACDEASASEVENAKRSDFFDIGAWVRVLPGEGKDTLGRFDDPSCRYLIEYPEPVHCEERKIHKNPRGINETLAAHKKQLVSSVLNRVTLHTRFSDISCFGMSVCALTASALAILFHTCYQNKPILITAVGVFIISAFTSLMSMVRSLHGSVSWKDVSDNRSSNTGGKK